MTTVTKKTEGKPARKRAKAARPADRKARAETGGRERSGQVQSLSRALSILDALAQNEGGLTLTEIAHTVTLAPSTTHRLLTTLQQERHVRFDRDRGLWQVGVQAFVIGNAFIRSRDIVAMARPFMRQLMETSGETVNLAVTDQGEAVYLSQVECREMMRALAKPGARVPMHCSAVGKALLAEMKDVEVGKILRGRGLYRLTDKTIDTGEALRAELAATRKRGYAIDDEEHAIGLRCVSAPIYDEYGEPLAAISLSGPMVR
ncbi:MAG: helix-turn-helix domain-containing protein, partial [Rhodospirillales bacterium]|nr:helix-turn-helix domain-containing protein [Rhodospirillales bacterium]